MENLIKDCFKRLGYLEEQKECSASLKGQIQRLKIELRFLRTFLWSRKLNDDGSSNQVKKTEDAIRDVGEAILSVDVEEVNLDLDGWLFIVLQKIELVKPDVDSSYGLLSFRIRLDGRKHLLVEYIDDVEENLKDLQQSKTNWTFGVKKGIVIFERKLRILRNSLHCASELICPLYYLLDAIEQEGTRAASFCFKIWINKLEENKATDLHHELHNWLHGTAGLLDDITDYSTSSDAFLVWFIDYLQPYLIELHGNLEIENSRERLCSDGGHLDIPKRDLFKITSEDLKIVKSLITTAQMLHPGHEESYRQHVKAYLKMVAPLVEDFYVTDMDEGMMTRGGDKILQPARLKLMNLFGIVDLLTFGTSLTTPIKDQLETFCEDIRLLRDLFYDMQKVDDENKKIENICSLMDDMALKASLVIYPFYLKEIKDYTAEKIKGLLHDLLEKIKLIKAEMRKIYPSPVPPSDIPGGKRGMTIFLKEVNELLSSRRDSISHSVKPSMRKVADLWVENLQIELDLFISFLKKSEERPIENEELIPLEISITNMANDAKCATETRLLNYYPIWYSMLKFSDIMEEVKLIKKKMKKISRKIFDEIWSSLDNNTAMNEVIVGFEDEAEKIIERLIGGPDQLNVISIVGMAGLGKTTLATKLYNNPLVVRHFDVQAWCCISQVFEERQVLLGILSQVVELTGGIYKMSDDQLADLLRKQLKGRRYLIVMDDIWEITPWISLKGCFIGNFSGSRIIFTTRLHGVASKVQERSILHRLRPFNDEESSELLRKKLFPNGRCPKEQVETVKQIAKSCKGLPLAVVLTAGVLVRKKKEEWKEVAESLSRHIDGDLQKLSKKVLEMSYQNLPDYLRPCFLYLGGFPEDKEILVKKLIWLWSAEGLIQKIEQRSLEDIAEDYLKDLIGRSLVIVAEKSLRGGVKAFRMHDVLRSFCLVKAKEQNFLLLLNGNGEPLAQQTDRVASCNYNPVTYEQSRLCIYSILNDAGEWSSNLDACSLLHYASATHLDIMSPFNASFIFSSFKSLNVLDFGHLFLKDLNHEIELLVHLRLLAVQIRSNSIPSSIANLRNLETLLVKGIRGEVSVPNTVWSILSLRHMHIDNRASLIWDKSSVKDGVLAKLKTLSSPVLSYGTDSGDMIRSLTNLQKLKCIFTESGINNESCCCFPELDSLIHLESLKVFYYGRKVSSGRFSFPLNLRKLTLSKFQLPWSGIAKIGALPNLEILKLLFRAFDGKQWVTTDGDFLKLKYLKLEALDIELWNVDNEDHFPVVEKLVVHRCKKLVEIPSTFGDINTLQMIEVKWCNLSAAVSAREIHQEQQDMGNESLKVIIHPYPSDKDVTSTS